MKAMILAAGEGTRLRPLTLETPKALLPVGGRPLIEHTLSWLKSHGISEVAINLHHLGEKIKNFLGDGSRFGMKIHYSPEEKLLGTAGGVKRMADLLFPQSLSPGPQCTSAPAISPQSPISNLRSPINAFVVVYGDNLTNFNLSEMIKFHRQKKALATLALFRTPNPKEVAVVELSPEGRVLSLTEKPCKGSDVQRSKFNVGPQISNLEHRTLNIEPTLASGGIYVLEKEVLDYIPDQGFCDFAYDIFPKLIKLGLPVYGYKLKPEDHLIDIGTFEKYQKANEDVKAGKVRGVLGSKFKVGSIKPRTLNIERRTWNEQ